MKNRWRIRATLRTTGELAIRHGMAAIGECDLIRDAANRPLIPGSAVKGVLRGLLARSNGTHLLDDAVEVFGAPPEEAAESDAQESTGGKAEFLDAVMTAPAGQYTECGDTCPLCRIHESVKLDPQSGASDEGFLRSIRHLPPGTDFQVEVVLDDATVDQAALIVALLRAAEGSARFGASAGGIGCGAKVGEIEIRRADAPWIVYWLQGRCRDHVLGDIGEDVSHDPEIAEAVADILGALGDSHVLRARLRLHFDGPVLVSARQGASADGEHDGKDEPDLVFMRAGDSVIIPKRSLTGAVRAQARRIASVLEPAEEAAESLFGDTGRMRALNFSDFVLESGTPARQEMVAVDRFTGGALDGAQFSTLPVTHAVFTGDLRLRFGRTAQDRKLSGKIVDSRKSFALSDEHLGLLALVLRDFLEGDAGIGLGATKGYGRLSRIEVVSVGFPGAGASELALSVAAALKGAAAGNGSALCDAASGWIGGLTGQAAEAEG